MSVESLRNREKYITLDRFLKDDHALLHVNIGAPGLDIPEYLTKQPTVTLKVSRNFRGAMRIDDRRGITADLLFGDQYYTCVVPFDAIWAMTSESGQMRMWPEDTPADILASIQAAAARAHATDTSKADAADADRDGDLDAEADDTAAAAELSATEAPTVLTSAHTATEPVSKGLSSVEGSSKSAKPSKKKSSAGDSKRPMLKRIK